MKSKYKIIICLLLMFLCTGCGDTAKKAVEEHLALYKNLDASVLSDMNTIIDKENLSDDNKKTYEEIFKKQYSDLTYEIENEEYNGDEATITVKVKVYDLYKSQKESTDYLINNPSEFNDEYDKYDSQKFIEYKLDKMKNTMNTTEYTIEFYAVKSSKGWTISPLSNSDLEKLHGIYDYES